MEQVQVQGIQQSLCLRVLQVEHDLEELSDGRDNSCMLQAVTARVGRERERIWGGRSLSDWYRRVRATRHHASMLVQRLHCTQSAGSQQTTRLSRQKCVTQIVHRGTERDGESIRCLSTTAVL